MVFLGDGGVFLLGFLIGYVVLDSGGCLCVCLFVDYEWFEFLCVLCDYGKESIIGIGGLIVLD